MGYEEMVGLLEGVAAHDHIAVSVEGQSVNGHDLLLVHLSRGESASGVRVLLIGGQHGDEHAGKDALLHLIRDIAGNPDLLPATVDLWIFPMINPDGTEADHRRNGNDFDLNRDHLILSQPETRALHRTVQRLRPHVAVDCHEFQRDSSDYTERGWLEWPQIMMDTAGNPMLSDDLYEIGMEWIESAEPVMAAAGHSFMRYHVGSAPPSGEQRFSTLDTDDARSGLATHGCLSFIIESGVIRGAEDPHADLDVRIDAYRTLLHHVLSLAASRAEDIAAVERARLRLPPEFIPVNFFWGNHGQRITEVPVIELETGEARLIRTPNFMHDRITKTSVPAPMAYAVPPEHADGFAQLLDRHAIAFERLGEPRTLLAERCRLLRIEEEADPIYHRYAGRQIVARDPAESHVLESGSLLVPVSGADAHRAALLLEPSMLFGLYQWEEWRSLVAEDGTLPVWRVTAPLDEPAADAIADNVEAIVVRGRGNEHECVTPLGELILSRPRFPERQAELDRDLLTALERLRAEPASEEALILVGRNLAWMNRVRDAVAVYSLGLQLHPNSAMIRRHRGHRLITLRQFEAAERDLTEAAALLDTDPMSPSAHHRAVWYHLGLSHFFQRDFEACEQAFERCHRYAFDDDMVCSSTYWRYLSLRHLGRDAEASDLLEPISSEMEIEFSLSYHELLLLFRGNASLEETLDLSDTEHERFSTLAAGIGHWLLLSGEESRAREIFVAITEHGNWTAFGRITAEVEIVELAALL
jgi:tetratricopeptide (TPR) repeat protein/predicted deacylase